MPRGGPQPGSGRPKGSTSKIGQEIRKAIQEALHEVGGKDYLVKLAKDNPQVFCALVSKIVPAEISIVEPTPFEDMTTDELIAFAGTVHAAAIGAHAESGGAEGTELPPSGSVPAVH